MRKNGGAAKVNKAIEKRRKHNEARALEALEQPCDPFDLAGMALTDGCPTVRTGGY